MAYINCLHTPDAKKEVDLVLRFNSQFNNINTAKNLAFLESLEDLLKTGITFKKKIDFKELDLEEAKQYLISVIDQGNLNVVYYNKESTFNLYDDQSLIGFLSQVYDDNDSFIPDSRFGMKAKIKMTETPHYDLTFASNLKDQKINNHLINSVTDFLIEQLGPAYVSPEQVNARSVDTPMINAKLDAILAGQGSMMAGQEIMLNELSESRNAMLNAIEASEYRLAGMIASVGEVLTAQLGSIDEHNMNNYANLLNTISQLEQKQINEEDLPMKTYRLLEQVAQKTQNIETKTNAITQVILGSLIKGQLGFNNIRMSGDDIMVSREYGMSMITESTIPYTIKGVMTNVQPLDAVIGGNRLQYTKENNNYLFNTNTKITSGKNEAARIDAFGPETGKAHPGVIMNAGINMDGKEFDIITQAGPYEITRDSTGKKLKDYALKAIRFALNYKATIREYAEKLLND